MGYEGYFDKNAVISQFTHLLKMLPFKEAYKNHSINILVDNSRTHSAEDYSLESSGMKSGTRCTVDQLQYVDKNGQQQIVLAYEINKYYCLFHN